MGINAQIFAKPQPDGAMAVFFLNSLPSSADFQVDLRRDLGLDNRTATAYAVRDIWEHQDLASIPSGGVLSAAAVPSRDSRLFLLTPKATPIVSKSATPLLSSWSWSGPTLTLKHTPIGGFPALQLDNNTSPIPPFWLNLNNQGHANLSHVIVQIIRAREAGLKLLAVVLSDALVVPPIASATQQIMDLVTQYHPTAKLLVRWYLSGDVLDHPEWKMVLQNISNPTQNSSGDMLHFMNTPAAAWAAVAAFNFSKALARMDAAYPGRIAAVVIEGLETGEWFLPPTSPASMMVGDYTPVMEKEFCEMEGGDVSNCSLPTATERNTATLGNALLQWENGSHPSARSFRYNQFVSQCVARAIAQFAAVVKNVSAGKALTMAYSGYLFDLSDSRLTGSGHLDLSSLLACPDLDLIGSPYQYSTSVREPAGRFTSHGPVDSATLHKKMWVAEDDSRTVLSDRQTPQNIYRVNSTEATVNLLRRNMYTSMLHRQALYWLDLESNGWWGRNDNATMIAITDAMWSNASHVLRQWQHFLASPTLQAQLLPPAEVAIFVDEISPAARPLLGRGGTIQAGYTFETALQMHPWQDIAGIGAPVRVYLMSDLLHVDFPFEEIKFAVFLNAFMMAPKLRQVVKTKLQNDGKTLAWVYAPALFDSEQCTTAGYCMPDEVAASKLVGLRLSMNLTAAPISTVFEQTSGTQPFVLPGVLVGKSYGNALGSVSPRVICDAEDSSTSEVIGRYADMEPSICWTRPETSNFSSVFVGTPRPPVGFWRALAKSAGVHVYTADEFAADDDMEGVRADAVEAAGSGLLYHAGTISRSSRRVELPGAFVVTSEWGEVVCASHAPCTSFETPAMDVGGSILYWLGKSAGP